MALNSKRKPAKTKCWLRRLNRKDTNLLIMMIAGRRLYTVGDNVIAIL